MDFVHYIASLSTSQQREVCNELLREARGLGLHVSGFAAGANLAEFITFLTTVIAAQGSGSRQTMDRATQTEQAVVEHFEQGQFDDA